jgi:hypothetical protein
VVAPVGPASEPTLSFTLFHGKVSSAVPSLKSIRVFAIIGLLLVVFPAIS